MLAYLFACFRFVRDWKQGNTSLFVVLRPALCSKWACDTFLLSATPNPGSSRSVFEIFLAYEVRLPEKEAAFFGLFDRQHFIVDEVRNDLFLKASHIYLFVPVMLETKKAYFYCRLQTCEQLN